MKYDVIIVGAGISGVYAGWRLLSQKNLKIAIFEKSSRIGGRLYSISHPHNPQLVADLGGMRFMESQESVYALVKHLKLDMIPFPRTPPENLRYLRRKHFTMGDYKEHPEKIPYNLKEEEQGKTPWELVHYVIEKAFPKVKGMSRENLRQYLKNVTYKDKPLWQVGYWNFLLDHISIEGYHFIRDAIAYESVFTNRNAYDALVEVALNVPSPHDIRLKNGFDQLPKTLANQFETAGGEIHLESEVCSIQKKDSRFEVDVLHKASLNVTKYEANQVVLAIPKRALQLFSCHSFFSDDEKFKENLNKVVAHPAFKLFMWFDRAWWRDLGFIEGSAETDLPLRKCYYIDQNTSDNSGLLLATFNDMMSVSYWEGYVQNDKKKGNLYEPSSEMIEEIVGELEELHKIKIAKPSLAYFVDWSEDPFGGGWHFWQIGAQSWELIPEIRKPFKEIPFYICGEAYSVTPGFVEGAINSAEGLLQKHFGLDRPSWISSSYDFGP